MQVTLTIPDEVVAQARANGVSVEVFVQGLVEQAVPHVSEMARRKMTKEELQEWFDEIAQFSDEIPPMPGETFSREMIYQDHD